MDRAKIFKVCVWTEPSMGTDLAQEPIIESAQENQDSDFRDELHEIFKVLVMI